MEINIHDKHNLTEDILFCLGNHDLSTIQF